MAGGGARTSARTRIRSSNDLKNNDESLPPPNFNLRNRKTKHRTNLHIVNTSFKLMIGVCLLAFVVILFMINHILNHNHTTENNIPRVITPFPAPKMMDLPQVINSFHYFNLIYFLFGNFGFCCLCFGIEYIVSVFSQFQGDHKESLYWGTYRPHVYLGIRARYSN